MLVGDTSSRSKVSAGAVAALSAAARTVGPRLTTELVAQVRAVMGVGMVVRPVLVSRALGVPEPVAQQTGWSMQMLGGREIALGAGTWLAQRSGDRRAARLFVGMSLVADAVDSLALSRAVGRKTVRPWLGGLGIAAAVGAVGVEAAEVLSDRD